MMNVRELQPDSSHSMNFSLDGRSIADDNKSTATASSSGFFTSDDGHPERPSGNKSRAKTRPSALRKDSVETITAKYQAQLEDSEKDALDLQSKGLVGREEQTRQLKACLARMLQEPFREDTHSDEKSEASSANQFVLFSGPDGSGKAKVARSLMADVANYKNGLFAQAKFDMTTSSEPLSGIAKCFGEICEKVMDSAPEVRSEVQAEIDKQLGMMDEAEILVQLVPELKHLCDTSSHDSELIHIGHNAIESRLERLRFAFRVLARIFSVAFSPLVLYFDNLHWADISSLQILDFLISDIDNERPLMIIGCYRSGTTEENKELQKTIVSMREKADTYTFQMTEITIEPFGVAEIEQIIQNIMPGLMIAKLTDLAALCHKRTHGNPYFTIEFVKMLHEEGLLQFTASSKTWSWDLNQIENATMSTDNVAVMLQDRITKMPQQEQMLLQCAAYLGSKFSDSMIDIVWTTYGRRLVESRIQPSATLLEKMVKEAVFEKVSSSQYRWVHDKLQEAALQLSEARRETFQLDIGRTLYYGLDKQQVDEELFTIVDLINNGNVLKLQEFAQANLRAAKKARDLSAFQSAAQYASHGISLLRENKWSDDRELALGLYVMGAEMELMLGNLAAADRYRDEVLAQSGFTAMDTFRIEMARANALGSTELKFDQSLNCYLELLRKLGHRVTWSRRLVPVQAIVKLVRTIKRAKSKPSSFYETMVPMKDPKQKAIVSVFSKLAYSSFLAGDILMYLLSVCTLVELTLDHGVNEYSATSFGSLAVGVVLGQQDFETATLFSEIALSMLTKFRGMHDSETVFLATMTLSWVQTLEECEPRMRVSIPEGLRSGEMEYAMWNIFSVALGFPYMRGKPIASFIRECSKFYVQSDDAAQAAHSGVTRIFWQMLHNMTDLSVEHPAELEGDIYSAASLDETVSFHVAYTTFAKNELSFFFSDYETTAKRALSVGDKYEKLVAPFPLAMLDNFHRAVALYAAAIQTKKRKYRVEAKRLSKKISQWVQKGNPNVKYYHLFLQAEQLALDKKYDMAEAKYEETLEAVTKEGHLHHLGLANQRFAEFLEGRPSKQDKSKVRLKEAIRYYREWGIEAKANSLETKLRLDT